MSTRNVSAARVTGLAYVVLRCADLERSREFYEALGLRLTSEQHGQGAKHYSCPAGSVVLELYPLSGKPSSGLRLGLVVSDLDGVLATMTAMGASVRRTASSTILIDPDGHEIALDRALAGKDDLPQG